MEKSAASPGAAVFEAPDPREMEPPEAERRPYPDRAARHWFLSSVVWLTVVDLIVIWLANVGNIPAPVAIRTIKPIYVSVWFFIASPIWLAVDYAIGNVIWHPGHIMGGAPSGALSNSLDDAILNWWYAHNLF